MTSAICRLGLRLLLSVILLLWATTPISASVTTVIPSYEDDITSVCNHRENDARAFLRQATTTLHSSIRGALQDVQLLRDLLEGMVENNGDNAISASFEDTFSTTMDRYYVDNRIDRVVERFVDNTSKNATQHWSWMEASALLFPIIAKRRGSQGAVWVGNSFDHAFAYYPLLHPSVLRDILQEEEQPFKQTNTSRNTHPRPYLVGPYRDIASDSAPVISAQIPVLCGEEDSCLATAGIDLPMAELQTNLQQVADVFYSSDRSGFAAVGRVQGNDNNLQFLFSTSNDPTLADLDSDTLSNLTQQITALEPGETSEIPVDLLDNSKVVHVHRWPELNEEDGTGTEEDCWFTILFLGPQINNNNNNNNIPQPVQDVTLPMRSQDPLVKVQAFKSKGETPYMKGTETYYDLNVPLRGEEVFEVYVKVTNVSPDKWVRATPLNPPPWIRYTNHSLDSKPLVSSAGEPNQPLPASRRLAPGETTTWNLFVFRPTLAGHAYGSVPFLVQALGTEEERLPQVVSSVTIFVRNTVHEHFFYYLGNNAWAGFAFAGFSALVGLGWSVWIFRNSSHHVVRASQPIFLYMMIAGLVTTAMGMVPMSIGDQFVGPEGADIACRAWPWFFSIGFVFTISALFSKVWRLNKIIAASRQYRRIVVQPQDVMIPFVVMIILTVIPLTVWTVKYPAQYVRQLSDDKTYSWGSCQGSYSPGEHATILSLGTVIAAGVFMTGYQLYKARGLATEYNEGKWVGITLATCSLLGAIGAPFLRVQGQNIYAAYWSRMILTFVGTLIMFTLTFLPKFWMKDINRERPPRPAIQQIPGTDEVTPNEEPDIEKPKQPTPNLDITSSTPEMLMNSVIPEEEEVTPDLPQRRLVSSAKDAESVLRPPHRSIISYDTTLSELTNSITDSEAEFWYGHSSKTGSQSSRREFLDTASVSSPGGPKRISSVTSATLEDADTG